MSEHGLVLVVDADEQVCDYLSAQFTADGFDTIDAASRQHMQTRARYSQPDALVLGELDDRGAALQALRDLRTGALAHEGLRNRRSQVRILSGALPESLFELREGRINPGWAPRRRWRGAHPEPACSAGRA